MNKDQKKYAMKRVDEIKTEKLSKIHRKNFTTDAVIFNPAKRLKLFKEGKFRINEKIEKNPFDTYENFRDVILVDGEKERVFNEKAYLKEINQVTEEASKIKDQIMLTNNPTLALDMIQKFNSSK